MSCKDKVSGCSRDLQNWDFDLFWLDFSTRDFVVLLYDV